MNERKLPLLITVSAFLLFSMNAWKNGSVNSISLIGGIGITILIYFIVSNVVKGMALYHQKQNSQNEALVNQVSQSKSAFEYHVHELEKIVNDIYSKHAEVIEKNHIEVAHFQEKLLLKMDTLVNSYQDQMVELQKSVSEDVESLKIPVHQQIKVLQEISANIVEKTDREEKTFYSYQEMVEKKLETIHQLIQLQSESNQENIQNQQNSIQRLIEQININEKSTQSSIQEQIERHLTKTDEVVNGVKEFSIEQQANFSKDVNVIVSAIQRLLEQIDANEKCTHSFIQEQVERHVNKTDEVVNSVKEFSIVQQANFSKDVNVIVSAIQRLMEQIDTNEKSTQSFIQEQIERHVSKTDEVIKSVKEFSMEQQSNFSKDVNVIISDIKTHSGEQLQSAHDLAQIVKDNGAEQHETIIHSLSSYQDGLNSILHSMEKSAIYLQTEISNQSNRQMDKIEEVIEKQKDATLLFHEKIGELVTNVETSIIDSQTSMVDSSNQQLAKLEKFVSTMNTSFEGMQTVVRRKINEQYDSVKTIISQLSNSVQGSQVILDGYTKEQVSRLNDVVGTMKSEITATINELKLQGHNQLDKMKDFLESSKEEAKVIQNSMNQHHDFLLKELENSLEKIIHYQTEENQVIVQKTSELINHFSEFHKELLGENKKQLEMTEEQQSKLATQIQAFKDMLIPLTDVHNNLQEMSKEEYKKLYETMQLLSETLVGTLETKDSLRAQIIRMQDDMLQKLG